MIEKACNRYFFVAKQKCSWHQLLRRTLVRSVQIISSKPVIARPLSGASMQGGCVRWVLVPLHSRQLLLCLAQVCRVAVCVGYLCRCILATSSSAALSRYPGNLNLNQQLLPPVWRKYAGWLCALGTFCLHRVTKGTLWLIAISGTQLLILAFYKSPLFFHRLQSTPFAP